MRNKLIHESNYIILHFFLSFFFIEKRSSEGQRPKLIKLTIGYTKYQSHPRKWNANDNGET